MIANSVNAKLAKCGSEAGTSSEQSTGVQHGQER
jgi:hypothetical protein